MPERVYAQSILVKVNASNTLDTVLVLDGAYYHYSNF
jgi:hypothetical protein